MSTTSSSDCECDNYNNFRTYTPIQPLYPELGHPLIYYAQIQKKPRTQQSGKVKNNCFLKAFRWYTEEHMPLKKMDSGTDNEDIQGFAAWLDQKYDEYIRKNLINQIASSQYLLKETSTVRTNKLTQNIARETSVPRKNKMKSPWRRRQKHLNKQNGDTYNKSDQSIEIILNPKSLSRSASECCQKCHRSNKAIMMDTNSPKTLKSKSESVIYILKEKEIYVVPSDTITDKKNRNDDKINISNGQTKHKISPAEDISCQCSNLKLEKVDACSQFSHTETLNVCECVEYYTKVTNERLNCPYTGSQFGICQRISEIFIFSSCCYSLTDKVLKEETNGLSTDRPSAVAQKSVPNTHSAIIPEETSFFTNTNIGKNEPSFSVNGIAQTSDHGINLSDVINPQYPIFLKIICADK